MLGKYTLPVAGNVWLYSFWVHTSKMSCIYCRTTVYIDQMGAWYDSRTKQEVMNLLILKQLQQAVGSFGLTGLDKLLSFMIVKELQVRELFSLSQIFLTFIVLKDKTNTPRLYVFSKVALRAVFLLFRHRSSFVFVVGAHVDNKVRHI